MVPFITLSRFVSCNRVICSYQNGLAFYKISIAVFLDDETQLRRSKGL